MDKIITLIKHNKLTLIGVLIGTVAGFLYWRFVGCSSGSCPITSSPYISSFWGAMIGGLLFSMFKKGSNGKDSE